MNLKALTKESKVTSKVLNDRTYRRKDDINSNGFAKSERMNAYKYGSDNITVTEGDQLTMKLAEERSFYLLGCLPKEKFDRKFLRNSTIKRTRSNHDQIIHRLKSL